MDIAACGRKSARRRPRARYPLIVRCTSRLLDLIGDKSKIADIEPSNEDWYGNAFWINGRKCVLVVHGATLYSVLALDIRVGDLRPPSGFVFTQIVRALDRKGLPKGNV
jgi:hypothetical protein